MRIAKFDQRDLLDTFPLLDLLLASYRLRHGGVVFEPDQHVHAVLFRESLNNVFAVL
jgi:hypothetical protein